ncbi:hypothetical protein H2198_002076 [Neophaeococcomyces mojaviensis]|uniref:Uncharacterized protein n=1 Tax=Neophaeococcomyces mojaviensis TaxID=3383035 RepID=A0ACC3AEZ5_9EURO|nr:hypothetical protein H2198_002076 [Knufia sp. JES_112]
MQQCRQHAVSKSPFRRTISSTHSLNNNPSLDPENFGKKLRISDDNSEPIPPWRLPKPELPSTTSRLNSLQAINNTAAAPTTNPYDFPRARDFPVPRYKHNPALKPGFLSFVKHRILRLPEPPNPHLTTKPAFNVLTNPYKARKQWPPILTQMSENQQFHYEKKFRRRLLNKTRNMRYDWDRWALFLRRFLIGFLIFYFAFVAEPPDPNTRVPPDGLRYWLYGQLRKGNEVGFWPGRVGGWIETQYQYYMVKHKKQWDPFNHDGWDESRPKNSLPRGATAAPALNRPLEYQEAEENEGI